VVEFSDRQNDMLDATGGFHPEPPVVGRHFFEYQYDFSNSAVTDGGGMDWTACMLEGTS